jgi:hypothetical protein
MAYQNKEVVYEILFQATAETLKTIAADPQHLGAEIGFFAVLHSWGQNLLFHPHLHCVVLAEDCRPMASGGSRAGRICFCTSRFCPTCGSSKVNVAVE